MSDTTGAASSLKWISSKVLEARQRVDAAQRALDLALQNQRDRPPETDGEDYEKRVREASFALSDAEDRAKGWLKQEKDFDKAVGAERRDSTDQLSRVQVETFAKMIAIYMRTGTEAFITETAGRILECRNEVEVHKVIAPKLRDNLVGAFESAQRESHVPAWLTKAIAEVF